MFMMRSPRKKSLAALAGIAVVAGVGVGAWWHFSHPVKVFPINPADHISSWTFKSPYDGSQALTDQTKADVARLTALLGKGEADDYSLYNAIGNDENLLGNGEAAYRAYNHAVVLDSSQGLAYANLGNLMTSLGAYYTAADAYAAAVHAQPSSLAFHLERLQFLTTKLPDNMDLLQAARMDARAQFGDNMSAILAPYE